jgi:hypothetical protein
MSETKAVTAILFLQIEIPALLISYKMDMVTNTLLKHYYRRNRGHEGTLLSENRATA